MRTSSIFFFLKMHPFFTPSRKVCPCLNFYIKLVNDHTQGVAIQKFTLFFFLVFFKYSTGLCCSLLQNTVVSLTDLPNHNYSKILLYEVLSDYTFKAPCTWQIFLLEKSIAQILGAILGFLPLIFTLYWYWTWISPIQWG